MTTSLFIVTSALLHVLSFPNFFHIEWAGWQAVVAWVALVPYFHVLRDAQRPQQSWWYGWGFGALSWAGILYWIAGMEELGPLALPAWLGLSAYLGLYQGLFGIGVFFLIRNPQSAIRNVVGWLLVPAWWVSVEWLQSHAFTGFPWTLMGQSQLLNLPIAQWAAWGGVYAVSFWVVWGNVVWLLMGEAFRRQEQLVPRIIVASLVMDVVLLAHGVGWWVWKGQAGRQDRQAIHAVLLQGNIPQMEKWDEALVKRNWNTYAEMAQGTQEADLVVWPETAVPFVLDERSSGREAVKRVIKDQSAVHVIGAPHVEVEAGHVIAQANRVWMFDSTGQPPTWYDKRHLVPFGEFTPFGWLRPLVAKYTIGVAEFRRGDGPVVLTSSVGRLAPLVCYEAVFPHEVRQAVKAGAQLLVNVTNDAWFERSAAPYQHAQAAAWRAIETRRGLVRAANTGVSYVVEPWGEIQTQSPLFEQHILMGMADVSSAESGYVRWGDGWILLLAILSAGGMVIGWRAARPLDGEVPLPTD